MDTNYFGKVNEEYFNKECSWEDALKKYRIDWIWRPENNYGITVFSDGNKFIAQMDAGYWGPKFLSVGYSCPNYAEIISDNMILKINKALDKKWKTIEIYDLKSMAYNLDLTLSVLYKLCIEANRVYNENLSVGLKCKLFVS